MYRGFIRLAQSLFPKAKICVDSFHVISNILSGFKEVIQTTLKQISRESKEYSLLKKYQYLLLYNQSNLELSKILYIPLLRYTNRQGTLVELLLDLSPSLRTAYQLKESYISFNRLPKFDENKFDQIVLNFRYSQLKPFESSSRMLAKNKEFIRNSFARINGKRISNGPIEARNKVVKIIISNASGYRNFELLKNRVLYVINNIESRKNQRK